ncbi:MAG: membrane integrity-associated transporter subunit PqiC [Victivallales bacterium]|nr:membrane integrity-associated transporter subunit PqiC [Victivallales bacterium]
MKKVFCYIWMALLVGCISVSRSVTSTYILCPDASASKQYNALVSVSGIELPEYLDRHSITVRVNKHTIGSLKGHQWAQNFRRMIQNSLSADLQLRSTGSKEAPNYSVYVQIHQFELDADNTLNVNANCILNSSSKGANGPCKTFVFSQKYAWGGNDVDELIGLYDKAIADMAEMIAGKAVGL